MSLFAGFAVISLRAQPVNAMMRPEGLHFVVGVIALSARSSSNCSFSRLQEPTASLLPVFHSAAIFWKGGICDWALQVCPPLDR